MGDRTWRHPGKGRPWPPTVAEEAIRLLQAGTELADVRRNLDARIKGGRGPTVNTIKKWAAAAGIDVTTGKDGSRDVTAALEARAAHLEGQRAELSVVLVDKLSLPAARLIADRLEDDEAFRPAIAKAKANLEAAIEELTVVGELYSDEMAKPEAERNAVALKAIETGRALARKSVQDARLALVALSSARVNLRDLVGVLTRSVVDHLALEGLAGPDLPIDRSPFVVELSIPEPNKDTPVTAQADLMVTPGGDVAQLPPEVRT